MLARHTCHRPFTWSNLAENPTDPFGSICTPFSHAEVRKFGGFLKLDHPGGPGCRVEGKLLTSLLHQYKPRLRSLFADVICF